MTPAPTARPAKPRWPSWRRSPTGIFSLMIWMLGTTRGVPTLRRRSSATDDDPAPLPMPNGTSARELLDAVMTMAKPGDILAMGRHQFLVVVKPGVA